MIIFINGAFGVGKTAVANALRQKLPDTLLFDPEEIGQFLSRLLRPIDAPDDFQHYAMWRSLVVTTIQLLQENYKRTLIVPMAIWQLSYFEEIVGALRNSETDFHHFCLIAPATIIRSRLRQRGDAEGGWSWLRVEQCCEAFQSSSFEKKIAVNTGSPEEIAENILTSLRSAD